MRLLYFAWLKTRIGLTEETVELPAGIATPAALVDWLKTRGPAFAEALKDQRMLRVAVNRRHVDWDFALKSGDEVALFPPVTGG